MLVGDAKVVEESHHLSSPLLERVPSHTTTRRGVRVRSASDTAPEPSQSSKKRKLSKRASEAGSSAPELGQDEDVDEADLTDFYAEIENSLEKDEGTSTKATSAPTPLLGKRLGAPPSVAIVSAPGPSHVGTSTCAAISGHARKSWAEVIKRQMDPLDSLARSALARDMECLIYMKVLLPPYTKEEWNGPHALEDNIFYKDIFKDLDNYRYTGLVMARNRLQEKFDQKAGYVKLLRSKVATLDDAASDKVKELQTKLTNAMVANIGYKEAVDGLREEVTRGLRMGRTDAEFEVVAHRVSNFFIGANADFKKALVDFPTTPFPFLGKIVAAFASTLSEVTQILSDKHIR
uniref:Uncharacterized protein n=1 Tax=Tanacetum cinerariifolium TaxID=118510 RepID=A0A6L2MTA0_TANCI|nr:hypothetical protein [Tanacetum cinerariifolium]